MNHLVAHAVPGTFLFHTWTEALALWQRLLWLGPPHALVVMPDHVHLVAAGMDPERWRVVLGAYAQWRNRHRGQGRGRVWKPSPPPHPLPDRQHLERTVRYVLLNPCRGQLCPDPLAWPFSTHRDAVGLAVPSARPAVQNPERLQRYVSADRDVAPDGTALPTGGLARDPTVVVAAVSALARTPVAHWLSATRDLAAATLRDALGLSSRAVAQCMPISRATVSRLPRADPDDVARVLQVAGDPRFPALEEGDLCRLPAWQRYLRQRVEKRLRPSGRPDDQVPLC